MLGLETIRRATEAVKVDLTTTGDNIFHDATQYLFSKTAIMQIVLLWFRWRLHITIGKHCGTSSAHVGEPQFDVVNDASLTVPRMTDLHGDRRSGRRYYRLMWAP
jgi:hypothetical protein